MMHSQFEAIHPFLDGNGRVGRLLITLFFVEREVLPTPLLYLSAFFEATRSEDYERLSAVTGSGDWCGWIEYFLNGVARMSEDVLGRARSINSLLAEWQQMVGGANVLLSILDLLEENPYCTIKKTAETLSIAFTTAQRAIDKLVLMGVLKQIGSAKRGRVYCAQQIMDILERPPVF